MENIMEHLNRRNIIAGGIATGALLLSGVRQAAAKQVTIKDFTQVITGYIQAQPDRIVSAFASRGGWEKWLQAELAAVLVNTDHTYDFSREERVYQNANQTVDFLFNGPGKDNPNARVDGNTMLIELKCESLYSQAKDLEAMMDDDANKLRTSNLKNGFQQTQRYVFGVGIQPHKGIRYKEVAVNFPRSTRAFTKGSQSNAAQDYQTTWIYYAQVTG
jgi:hypothetical protein